jgi:ankyrin repeat protein
LAVDPAQVFCRALWRREHATIAALASKIDPNAKDKWGNTPLLSAAQYGDLALVKLLVLRGGNVDQGRTHLTPLTFAARRGAPDIVAFLLNKGAISSIVTLIYLGDRERFAQSLKRDPKLATLRDEAGTPILHHAAESLHTEMAELLLESGATVSDTDANGETPLHRVADIRRAPQRPTAKMATLLLDHGADPNAKNWDHVTPLHQAVRARNLAVVEVLLERGADPNAKDKLRGSTPLRRAVSGTGASETAGTSDLMVPLTKILLEHGADPNARDKRGLPVHASAKAPDVRAILEEHRRNAGAKSKASKTKAPKARPPKKTTRKR